MKSIELFAGAGGLGMGTHRAGFEPLMLLEWDRWCCAILRENLATAERSQSPSWRSIEGDARAAPLEAREHVAALIERESVEAFELVRFAASVTA